ncbi:MAG: hypothetical protein K9N01_10190 [Cephaloticoccus sp.]|nr:hypothetical protein [Cephaloticoccus sp.]
MKHTIIKNTLFNIAAIGVSIAALRYLPISSTQLFSLLAMAGIGLIAVKDYSPRRRLRFASRPVKPVAQKAVRRRVPALVAA